MISRTRQFTSIAFLFMLIISTTACTTTTKKLTKTEPRIDSASQLAKARQAYNQKNYEQAATLLTPLAEQGDANAQYALGYLYHNGLGVPRNYKLAIQWMTAASAKGNEKATEALRRISELGSDAAEKIMQEEPATPEPEPMEPLDISGKQSVSTETPKPTAPTDVTAPSTATESTPVSKPETETQTMAASMPTETPKPTALTDVTAAGITTETTPVSKPEAETQTMTASMPTETPEPALAPAETETPEPAASMAPQKTGLNDDEKWIMEQSKSGYTIQLIATGNKPALQQFISENNLQSTAKYYKSQKNNKEWYTLIQGSYDSPAVAKKAIDELSPGLQELKPWVKPFAGIQETLSGR